MDGRTVASCINEIKVGELSKKFTDFLSNMFNELGRHRFKDLTKEQLDAFIQLRQNYIDLLDGMLRYCSRLIPVIEHFIEKLADEEVDMEGLTYYTKIVQWGQLMKIGESLQKDVIRFNDAFKSDPDNNSHPYQNLLAVILGGNVFLVSIGLLIGLIWILPLEMQAVTNSLHTISDIVPSSLEFLTEVTAEIPEDDIKELCNKWTEGSKHIENLNNLLQETQQNGNHNHIRLCHEDRACLKHFDKVILENLRDIDIICQQPLAKF